MPKDRERVPGPGVEPGDRPYERRRRTRAPGVRSFHRSSRRRESRTPTPCSGHDPLKVARLPFRHPAHWIGVDSQEREACVGTESNRHSRGRPGYGQVGSPMPCRRVKVAIECPRRESNLVFDLRRVACESITPRGRANRSGTGIIGGPDRAPCPGVEPGLTASKAAVRPPHSQGKCPRQESNLVFDLRRVACESVTPQGPVRRTKRSRRDLNPRPPP
jgi:hypothetical protein